MKLPGKAFLKYVVSSESKPYLLFAFATGVVYFVSLRFLYPVPSFSSDSYTWVGAAVTWQPVTFRPIGYSKLLIFFNFFSTSDIGLIAAQYFCNLLANLFLFFTCTRFFSFKKIYTIILFILLIINPLYLFHSNYVSSDAFFNSLTVVWFTLLIWVLHKPSWPCIIAQMVVIAALFLLRYNAIFFPVIAAFTLLITKGSWLKKVVGSAGTCLTVVIIMVITTFVTKSFTGTKTFSAFSGWQMANNALHVLHNEPIDTAAIEDKEVKAAIKFAVQFLDTSRPAFRDTSATAYYMWYYNSPLKRYMTEYPGRKKSYFGTWNALGPLYSKMGRTIILQEPLGYIKHFALPNAYEYLFPRMEIYDTYMEGRDTIAAIATKFFHYKSKKTPPHHPGIYAVVFTPMKYLFTTVNILFVIVAVAHFITRRSKNEPLLFNKALLCFTAFYLANFFFIVLLAPSVFRYHIPVLTLSFPFLLYLFQQSFKSHLRRK